MPGQVNASIVDDDAAADDDDDDDEDLYEESSLESFTTPLDEENPPVDEYEMFKNVLQEIEGSNPEWYAQLVMKLNAEDVKTIQGIITLCAQRKAMKESKSIEKAGGLYKSL